MILKPTADLPSGSFVLASASPRRARLLDEAGLSFRVVPSRVKEEERPGESASALADRLAREKALDVAARLGPEPATRVLGADTIVVLGDEVLGKPRDESHAVELLSRLAGNRHRVLTGIAVGWSDDRGVLSRVVTTEVTMRKATRQELLEYVALGESLDKAGGYALQGAGSRFVVDVRGSRSNVIGLPLEETLRLLDEAAGLEADASPASRQEDLSR